MSPPNTIANSEVTTAADLIVQQAEDFAGATRQYAATVFGREEPARRMEVILKKLLEDIHRLHERGGESIPALALIGRVGEGKSWLARAFIDAEKGTAVRQEIRSGQNDADRTQELIWLGPEKPFALVGGGERYFPVAQPLMLDLGQKYILGDTPGFSDPSPQAWRLASVAATSAPIKLLVTSLSQLRDGGVEDFVATMNGATILPIIKFEPASSTSADPSETALRDVAGELRKWQARAPDSNVLPPCFMPQRALFGEDATVQLMRQRLRIALASEMATPQLLSQSVVRQMEECLRQARSQIGRLLVPFRDRIGQAVDRLDALTHAVPQRIQRQILGDEPILRAAIRQRLRADWMERTPAICFPFRTFAGLFALTHGAWDRLFFTALGSVPSLAVTLYKTARNFREGRQIAQLTHNGLEQRTNRLLAEEFRPAIRNFESAVHAALSVGEANTGPTAPLREARVYCQHLSELDQAAETHLQETVHQHRATKFTVLLLALAGTGSAIWLISGPVVSLYSAYLQAHSHALTQQALDQWAEFPQPSASFIFSSLLLSFAPTCLLALIAIAWSCPARRVQRIAAAFTRSLEKEIASRLAAGTLSIQLDEPRLEAVRHLLTLVPPASEQRPVRLPT